MRLVVRPAVTYGDLPAHLLTNSVRFLRLLIGHSDTLSKARQESLILRHCHWLHALTLRVTHCESLSVLASDSRVIRLVIRRFIVRHWFLLSCLILSQSVAFGQDSVICADGYAIKVPAQLPFAGGYLPCEQLDRFMSLLEQHRTGEAGALVVGGSRRTKGFVPRGTRRESDPKCYVTEPAKLAT